MFIETIGTTALALSLPGSLYLTALTAAALRKPRQTCTSGSAAMRLVIVVPAHNEAEGLQRTLHNLKQDLGTDMLSRIAVVADNCSDDTALVARAAGVEVLERHDLDHRGKGFALRHAFETLSDADAFIVVDADTDVEPGFVATMRSALAAGADALQCRYGVRDATESRGASLADVAMGAWNVLRPRGRAALGVSVGLLGNGFALSRKALQAVPYSASSIVEDVEYHHLLVQAGIRVQWVDDACVRGDMPQERSSASQQRARWEGGRLRLLRERAADLAARCLGGQWRFADPLLDLMTWPLAWLVSLLGLALAVGGSSVQWAASAGLVMLVLHVLVALCLMPARWHHLRALLGVPAYLAWKLCLAARIWQAAGRNAPWVRSQRGAS